MLSTATLGAVAVTAIASYVAPVAPPCVAHGCTRAGPILLQTRADLSQQMQEMRDAMAADERSAAFVAAMRATNLNDDDVAAAGTTMRVVEMRKGEDSLPTVYDPDALSAYFARRPWAVLTRLVQIGATAGAWGLQTAVAASQGKLTPPGSEGEVRAVAGLRRVLVSLGPFFIKVRARCPSPSRLLSSSPPRPPFTLADCPSPAPDCSPLSLTVRLPSPD